MDLDLLASLPTSLTFFPEALPSNEGGTPPLYTVSLGGPAFDLCPLPERAAICEAPDGCSHLAPAGVALLQPRRTEPATAPRARGMGTEGGSELPPSLLASELPGGFDSK